MLREWILLVIFRMPLSNSSLAGQTHGSGLARLVKQVLPLCSQSSETMIFIVSLVHTGILVVVHYIRSLYGMARIVIGMKHHAVHQVNFHGFTFTSPYRLLLVMILSLEFVVHAQPTKMMKMSLLIKLSFM